MKKSSLILFTILFSLCLSVCGSDNAGSGDINMVLIDTDFEDGTYSPWEAQYSTEDYSILISEENPRTGNKCIKFTIGVNDYWLSPYSGNTSARSEINLKNTAPYHADVYYAWSMLIPSDYTESNDWQVTGQFHDQPDTSAGETWSTFPARSPPLAYNLKGNKVQLTTSLPDNIVRVISERVVEKDVWIDIITHVYWSTEDDGFVEAWINGEQMTSPDGTTTRYYHKNLYNKAGNYLQIGLYRSKSIETENSIYYDEIRSGYTFDSVQAAASRKSRMQPVKRTDCIE